MDPALGSASQRGAAGDDGKDGCVVSEAELREAALSPLSPT